MATLTYDSTEYQEGEFSQEELDSLAVGEQLEEQQNQLLAGKYRDAEELEQAYIELQRKLGDPTKREEPTNQEQEVAQEEPENDQDSVDFLERLWEESLSQYSQETLEQLQQMDPSDVAQMYLQYRAQVEQETQSAELSDQTVAELQGIVGGQEQYATMMSWASQNLSEQDINMYDEVMERGDPLACFFAIQALAFRYQDAAGYDGQMLTGKAPVNQQDVFRSQAEVVRAMSDPRYDNDPAYRQDVFDKLERSDLQF